MRIILSLLFLLAAQDICNSRLCGIHSSFWEGFDFSSFVWIPRNKWSLNDSNHWFLFWNSYKFWGASSFSNQDFEHFRNIVMHNIFDGRNGVWEQITLRLITSLNKWFKMLHEPTLCSGKMNWSEWCIEYRIRSVSWDILWRCVDISVYIFKEVGSLRFFIREPFWWNFWNNLISSFGISVWKYRFIHEFHFLECCSSHIHKSKEVGK